MKTQKIKQKILMLLVITLVVMLMDLSSKYFVVQNIEMGSKNTLIKGLLDITYEVNTGFAFGTSKNNILLTLSLALITTFLFIAISLFISNNEIVTSSISIAVGGSISNLVGRIFNSDFGVVDMFTWKFSFLGSDSYIFNLADVFIIFGVSSFVVSFLVVSILDEIKEKKSKKEVSE